MAAHNVSGLELFVPDIETPPQRMVDQWAETYKLNLPRMIEKIRLKFPDDKAFLENLVNPAAIGWKGVINPAFKSRSGRDSNGIKNAHRANLKRSYDKYDTAMAHIFETLDDEEAKRLKEIIDAKKDIFAAGIGARTLRFTGDKIRGRGVAPLAAMWLTGDIITPDLLRPADVILYGGPVDISKAGLTSQVKSGLVSKLISGGIAIVHSEMDAARITTENGSINDLCSALRDDVTFEEFVEPLTPLKSHCGYYMDNGQLFLRIQVVAL